MSNVWKTMSQIDTRKLVEKKNGFTYLSWSHALKLLKDNVPDAMVTKHVFQRPDGTLLPFMVDAQGYAYVQVTVTLGKDIAGATEVMPVLNHANRPIQNPNSFEVNASLQRCMAKAISMATGLGLHLYSGEDTPTPSFAGPGNPGNKANEGAVSHNSSSDDKTVPDAVPSGNLKKLSLAEEVSQCPDIDALKALYNRVQLRLSADDRQLFSNRKKELVNG